MPPSWPARPEPAEIAETDGRWLGSAAAQQQVLRVCEVFGVGAQPGRGGACYAAHFRDWLRALNHTTPTPVGGNSFVLRASRHVSQSTDLSPLLRRFASLSLRGCARCAPSAGCDPSECAAYVSTAPRDAPPDWSEHVRWRHVDGPPSLLVVSKVVNLPFGAAASTWRPLYKDADAKLASATSPRPGEPRTPPSLVPCHVSSSYVNMRVEETLYRSATLSAIVSLFAATVVVFVVLRDTRLALLVRTPRSILVVQLRDRLAYMAGVRARRCDYRRVARCDGPARLAVLAQRGAQWSVA